MTNIAEALRRINAQQQTIERSVLAFPVDTIRECSRLAEVSADFATRPRGHHTDRQAPFR